MKKSELKTGMVITMADGEIYTVYIDAVIPGTDETKNILVNTNKSGWIDLDNYNDLLYLINTKDDNTTLPDEEFEIVKIAIPASLYHLIDPNSTCANRQEVVLYEKYALESDFEFIWGILSKDNILGAEQAGLYTMNDFDIIYSKEDDTYSFSVETIYDMSASQQQDYLNHILAQFTNWMQERLYDTTYPLDYCEVFTNFDKAATIAELYAKFKLLVEGLCSNMAKY